ncbi:MAG: serine/threonine protein kinase [Candidatus Promineifilaceae bacterium]|jgi:serine/threonine protein kinase
MVTEEIGQYLIEEIIGSGGMARVYKAFDDRVKRYVAVKMLGEYFTNQDYLFDRFEQEARLIASLEHHAIVPVYDYGDHDGRPYIVMRLMTGGSLADRLEEGPMDLQSISSILNRICAALDKAHSNDVIHRDIKPGNILFDDDGIAFLADFGIARFSEMTQPGVVVGSPHYMSPEQARGHPIDPRSDVYQLGILLFEMLTGSLPFDGDSIDSVIYQHVHEPVPMLTSFNPDLTPNLQALINDSLAKDRDKRIGTASELASRLADLTPVRETSASRNKPPVGRLGGRIRRTLTNIETDTVLDYPTKRRFILPRIIMWLAGIVALIGGLYMIPPVRNNPTIRRVSEPVIAAIQEVPSIAQDLQQNGADAIIELAGLATPTPTSTIKPTATQEPALVVEIASTLRVSPTLTKEPNITPSPVAPTDTPLPEPTNEPTPTLAAPEPTSTPDTDVIPPTEVSPNTLITGRELAELTGSSGSIVYSVRKWKESKYNLSVRDIEGNVNQITTDNVNDFGAVWSPDGNTIAYFSVELPREITLINPDGSNKRLLTTNGNKEEFPAFDPTGQLIIFHSDIAGSVNDDSEETVEFKIYTIPVVGPPNSEILLVNNGNDNFAPSFSPDGKKIAFESIVGQQKHIFVYDLSTQEEIKITPFTSGVARNPVWSMDKENQRIAFFYEHDNKSDIYTVNPDGTELTTVTSGFEFDSFHPSWAPNGQYLIFHADMKEDNNNRDLWIIKPNGTGLRRVTDTPDREEQAELRPLANVEN